MKRSQAVAWLSWETLSSRELLKASPWLEVWIEAVRLPDGRIVDDYYTVKLPDYSIVAALDSQERFIVERHYKHGARRVILTLPAGAIDRDETPVVAAQRELLEETGYGGGDWFGLGSFVVDGNRGCGQAHLFLARHVEQLAEPRSDDLEEQKLEFLSQEQIDVAIEQGVMGGLASVGTVMLASRWLQRNRLPRKEN